MPGHTEAFKWKIWRTEKKREGRPSLFVWGQAIRTAFRKKREKHKAGALLVLRLFRAYGLSSVFGSVWA